MTHSDEFERAFADVVEPAGIVALLSMNDLWHNCQLNRPLRSPAYAKEGPFRPEDPEEVAEILAKERQLAFSCFANSLRREGRNISLEDEAARKRAVFDLEREVYELKHREVIGWITSRLDPAKSSQELPS